MKIKDLLNTKEKWTTDCFARDINGNPVTADDENATCYCLVGAIYCCYPFHQIKRVTEKLSKTIQKLYRDNLPAAIALENDEDIISLFNDNLVLTTFENVKQVLKVADV